MVQDRIREIVISKDVINKEWLRKSVQETRDDIRSRRSDYFMTRWKESFPDYDFINFDALMDLANRSDKVSRWYGAVDADFNATLNFPDWAGKAMTEEQRLKVDISMRRVGEANRKSANIKLELSKKFKELSAKVDEQHASDIKAALENNIPAFILSFPKNQLPVHLMISIVAVNNEYRKAMKSDPDFDPKDHISPGDYEAHLLDAFRKKLWDLYMEGADVKESLKEMGVDFFIPTKSVPHGHLSTIMKLVQQEASI